MEKVTFNSKQRQAKKVAGRRDLSFQMPPPPPRFITEAHCIIMRVPFSSRHLNKDVNESFGSFNVMIEMSHCHSKTRLSSCINNEWTQNNSSSMRQQANLYSRTWVLRLHRLGMGVQLWVADPSCSINGTTLAYLCTCSLSLDRWWLSSYVGY